MARFKNPLTEIAEYQELAASLKKERGPLLLSGCTDSEAVHVASELAEGTLLYVTYSDQRAQEIVEDLKCYEKEAYVYPSKDLLFYEADIRGNLLSMQRMTAIKALLSGREVAIVASAEALMEKLPEADVFKTYTLNIATAAEMDIEELQRRLTDMGYEHEVQVEEPGQYATRGGIIDIYPLTGELPVRVEFWGEEIDSIRTFDPETQRSIENIDAITIFPVAEISPKRGHEVSLADYFPKSSPLFVEDPMQVEDKLNLVFDEYDESVKRRIDAGIESAHELPALRPPAVTMETLVRGNTLFLAGFESHIQGVKITRSFQIQAQSIPSYAGNFETLIEDLRARKRSGARVVLLAGSGTRAERLAESLREYELDAIHTEDDRAEAPAGKVLVLAGNLHKGFAYPIIDYYVMSEGDLYGKKKKKRRRRSHLDGKKITELSSLSVGDYVIHENHGLGKYCGTERVEVSGISKDYIKITYGDGGNLYVPVTQMDVVQKYADADTEKVPRLNRLGGGEWKATKAKVKRSVYETAEDLVNLYALRSRAQGVVYGPDTVWQREFEEQFPYEETEDQLAAIEAVKQDMESGKVMDRLICGDVGFGKTEIALRAAFKAVQEGKQVAYLVPTTILAEQHYNTFVQRLKDYPVSVELLCRFRTAKQQKKSVEEVAKGMVDIVIGTHRLLSEDVSFKNLGLLIIDEEQRFGVADKEKIKKLKNNVDVLSLTATPIPRTLHMSMIGVRDMSLLREAPQDRVPIQTYVMEYNGELVREAISRELARGGQVYYVYNKVDSIGEMAEQIKKLVPDAEVAYAHGKMNEHQLERIMLDFVDGAIDVLVSTTIVETGIDISNVNTILIHDADKFGLSQLYQLRGRVGRSNRTAYAFLLYRRGKMLKEIAEKRLSTIKEFSELGSGVKIAMKDLELRGAGNILGKAQHGHMEAVGYELYCKMLGNAVRELSGQDMITADFDTGIDIPIDAYLPETYIKNESQRLGVYRRIAGIETDEDYGDVSDELIDRFGDMPAPVENLLKVARIKAKAHEAYVTDVTGDLQSIRFSMYNEAPVDTGRIPVFLSRHLGDIKIATGSQVSFTYVNQRGTIKDTTDLLKVISDTLDEIRELTRGEV
ncbi:MAG: transcription-repair coupling factor [Lachnospiraceae bacterium]|nr:transcription-repair coupling factor [Candidatus Minthocola equi]